MTSVIPIGTALAGDEDLFEELSPTDKAVKILEEVFPRLCADVAMLVHRPFQFIWDPTISTASTDCKAEIHVSPHFFLEGREDVGFGTTYHECGHIRYSPYGVQLLERAAAEGGETLRGLMNIILDRKDDILTAQDAPGFADTLRGRLVYICTMARQRELEEKLGALHVKASPDLIRHTRPRDPYEDFFFAAKWHRSPRFRETHRAMKYCKRTRLIKASPEELFWVVQKVRECLGEPPASEQAEKHFQALMAIVLGIESGGKGDQKGIKLDPKLAAALNKMVQKFVARIRASGLGQLLKRLKAMPMVHPGPLSTGVTSTVPVKKVEPNNQYLAANQALEEEVRPFVEPLARRLRRLDNPSEFVIFGQDEGELDLTESARIATGLNGYHQETVVERDIDAELHLAIDCSGSMAKEKIRIAKKIAKVFEGAIGVLAPACLGHLWAFSSEAIYDFGPPHVASAVVTAEGESGNSDTHMLQVVGKELLRSRKRRKILLVLADDGPDDMAEASRLSHQLMARGVLVVHLLVGVHGTPNIYPIELLYTSMEECLAEFGDLLEKIIGHLR